MLLASKNRCLDCSHSEMDHMLSGGCHKKRFNGERVEDCPCRLTSQQVRNEYEAYMDRLARQEPE